jgi:hypothetical protein
MTRSTPTRGFGEKLRRERERRDTRLQEIADTTRIGYRYLEALERDEIDALPGSAFGKLYIRAYAEVLGLDAEPLVAEYDRMVRERRRGDSAAEAAAPRDAPRGPSADLRRERFARLVDAAPRQRRGTAAPEAAPEPDPAIAAARRRLVEARSRLRRWPAPRGGEAPGPAGTVEEPAPEPALEAAQADQALALPADGATRHAPGRRGRILAAVGAASVLALLAWIATTRFGGDERSSATRESAPDAGPAVAAPEFAAEVPQEAAAAPGSDSGERPGTADAAQPDTTPPRAVEPGALSVPEFGVGTGIVGNRLRGAGDRFAEGSVVWFSTRVAGGRPGERIRHVWFRGEGRVQTIELGLGGPSWRTHSSKTLWGRGPWSVEVRDDSDRVLARAGFECVARDR